VENLVSEFARLGPSRRWIAIGDDGPHEATNLSLSIERAREILGWTPRLSFEETAAWTDAGYVAQPDHLPRVVERQIADYEGLRSS
jgi:nucleoside-diphosphate-sugar epimerase